MTALLSVCGLSVVARLADGDLRLLDDVHAVIARELDRYLPFLATTAVLVAAVQRGMGRETAHEAIKEHAVAVALEMRDRRTALSAFGSVTKLEPTHGAAWAQLARLFASAGQPNRADAALRKAIENEDGNPVIQDLIGTVHQALGDQRDVRRRLGQALGFGKLLPFRRR